MKLGSKVEPNFSTNSCAIVVVDATKVETYRFVSARSRHAREAGYRVGESGRIRELRLEFPWPRGDGKVSPNTTLAASPLPAR